MAVLEVMLGKADSAWRTVLHALLLPAPLPISWKKTTHNDFKPANFTNISRNKDTHSKEMKGKVRTQSSQYLVL